MNLLSARTRELPGNYPFVVQETFIKVSIDQWREPSLALCQTVYNTLSVQLKALVKTHFQSFGQGHLEQRIRTILQQHLKECYERAQRSIDWVIALENRPFSTNEHYFFDYREKFLAHYRGTRQQQRNGSLVQSISSYADQAAVVDQPSDPDAPLRGIAKVLSGLAEMGFQGIIAENLIKLLPADEMEPALNIMADSRAYFQGG